MRERPTRTQRDLYSDRSGVTALEYGLLAGLLGAALIGALSTISVDLRGLFGRVDAGVAAVGSHHRASTDPDARA